MVIVDLKGDKALFESCRREAARTRRLRFRWISNEVGKTTFGFNPFLQSHNAKLSVEQLTQQLLQGLSLDYGIKYGAGYFTAMNEIVLNNVLRETGARSFQPAERTPGGPRLVQEDWVRRRLEAGSSPRFPRPATGREPSDQRRARHVRRPA